MPRSVRHVLARWLPLPRRKACAAVFLFHTVEAAPSPWTAGHRYVTPVARFREQVRFIEEQFEVVTTEKLVERLKRKGFSGPRASRPCTFDDGFLSYRDEALPILRSLGLPSAVFLTFNLLSGYIPMRNKLAFCLDREKPALMKVLGPFFDRNAGTDQMTAAEFSRGARADDSSG